VQEQEIRALVFNPDGHWLVTAGADGTARRWNLHLDELKRLACEKAGRNLTREEWKTYIFSEPYQETEPCPELPKAF
jgi:WD40 repeat protein